VASELLLLFNNPLSNTQYLHPFLKFYITHFHSFSLTLSFSLSHSLFSLSLSLSRSFPFLMVQEAAQVDVGERVVVVVVDMRFFPSFLLPASICVSYFSSAVRRTTLRWIRKKLKNCSKFFEVLQLLILHLHGQ